MPEKAARNANLTFYSPYETAETVYYSITPSIKTPIYILMGLWELMTPYGVFGH